MLVQLSAMKKFGVKIIHIACSLLILLHSSFLIAEDSYSERTLTIAVNGTSYPYHFINEDEEVSGVMVDLWRLWAQKQDVEIKFVASSWQTTIDNVRNNSVDIHAGLSVTENRNKYLSFTERLFAHNSHIFIHRDFVNLTEVEQLKPYIIGAVKGSSNYNYIREAYPFLKIRSYDNRHQVYDAALNNEIIAFVGLEKLSKNYPNYKLLVDSYPPYKRIRFKEGEYASAVALGNKKLLHFINQGFEKVTTDEKAIIEKRWLGQDRKDNTLLLGFTPLLPPYMAVSPTGKPQGLFIDLWRMWGERTGHDIEFIAIRQENALEALREGDIEVHIAYPANKKQQEVFLPAHKVYGVNSAAFVHKSIDNIYQLSDLSGYKVGLFRSAPYRELLVSTFPEIDFIVFDNYIGMFQAAENLEIVAIVAAVENMTAKLIQNNLQSYFYQVHNEHYQSEIFSLVQPDNYKLAEEIAEGFQRINMEDFVSIEQRWLSEHRSGYYSQLIEQVTLSSEEKLWVEQNKEIYVGISKNWLPIEFVDKSGEVTGINPNIFDKLSKRTNLKFNYVVFENFHELFKGIVSKQVDMIGSTSVTQDRQEKVLFTQSYWEMPWAIIHQSRFGNELELKDFYGKTLAVIKGYYLVEEIKKEHPLINLKIVDDHEAGLLQVQQGLVNGFIANIASASELLKRESLVHLIMSISDELAADMSHIAIRNDWPIFKNIMNKALLTVSESEKKEIYDRWFGVSIKTGLNKDVVVRVGLQIGAVIIVVIVVIVAWNRRLYVEIKRRKSLEEKMKHMATHDELTGLANRVLLKDRINTAISFHKRQKLQIAVLFIDLDGFKNINDTYGHDVGDELLIKVANKLKDCVRQSDTVVRFGGDEFVLLLTGLHQKTEAAFIADKVLKLLQQPFKLSAVDAQIGCSIGIAMYPEDGQSDNDLLKMADMLMYKVKASGKNNYVFN